MTQQQNQLIAIAQAHGYAAKPLDGAPGIQVLVDFQGRRWRPAFDRASLEALLGS